MRIKEQNLKKIQEIQKWKGKGTEEDPLIMDFINKSDKYLVLNSIKDNLIIKNFQAQTVTLNKCQNITIINCHIHNLYMKFCQKIHVIQNIIHLIQAPFSKNCIIRNNKTNSINFDFNSINHDAEQLIIRENFTNFSVCSGLFFIFGVWLIVFGLIISPSNLEILINIGIIIFAISIFCASFAFFTKYRISKIKKLTDNIYENNTLEN